MEREFIMVKPDGVQRGLIGEVIKRIEKVGLKIIAMKMFKVSMVQAEKHYEIHKDKPFYNGLVEYITCDPVVAMVVEGKNVVKITRKLVGSTNPLEAEPGSIRGDYALEIGRNIIHAGDSPENAKTEYSIYFTEDEMSSYKKIDADWLYE
ncbi:MAG: nucleoside-diphosphate kinase [Candidatus Heimdallarchaeota archaeon]|nr:nucleoside-diphosphate kinase [Candidatus Heimdallarchaeota archaeon]